MLLKTPKRWIQNDSQDLLQRSAAMISIGNNFSELLPRLEEDILKFHFDLLPILQVDLVTACRSIYFLHCGQLAVQLRLAQTMQTDAGPGLLTRLVMLKLREKLEKKYHQQTNNMLGISNIARHKDEQTQQELHLEHIEYSLIVHKSDDHDQYDHIYIYILSFHAENCCTVTKSTDSDGRVQYETETFKSRWVLNPELYLINTSFFQEAINHKK